MARKNLTAISVDVSQLEGLGGRLSALDPNKLGESLVETLNSVANDAYKMSRDVILGGINIREDYFNRKMEVKAATLADPKAVIKAEGDRGTGLAQFDALGKTKRVNWTNDAIEALGYKFGKWPAWTMRTGDPGRGIEEDYKQAGFTVEVTRGSRKAMPGVFEIPGIEHSDGTPVLFKGTGSPGKGKMSGRKTPRQGVEALYGPSVYQLFRTAADQIGPWVADDLSKAVADRVELEIEKVLS